MDLLVCTDAGLSSATNRVFNSYDGEDGLRGYITTQPVKTLKEFLPEWCLADDGWSLDGDDSRKKYKISELDGKKIRIMKTDFEARPVYLNRKERILAHFITCFISLIVYRYLEKKLDIINTPLKILLNYTCFVPQIQAETPLLYSKKFIW